MPSVTILPNFQVVNAQELYWPSIGRAAAFANVVAAGNSRVVGPIGETIFFTTGGSVQGNMYPPIAGMAGVYHANVGNSAAGLSTLAISDTIGNYPIILRLADVPTPALAAPEQFRVMRWTWWMAVTGTGQPTADDFTGCVWSPHSGVLNGQPTGGNVGWGVVMDGAGNWQYRNYSPGGFPGNIAETVAFPPGVITSALDWNVFDVQMIGGSPTRNASWDLVVNGTLIVSRNWVSGGGAELADYGDVAGGLGTTIGGFQAYTDNDANPNTAIRITNMTVTAGKFTRNGLEIQT